MTLKQTVRGWKPSIKELKQFCKDEWPQWCETLIAKYCKLLAVITYSHRDILKVNLKALSLSNVKVFFFYYLKSCKYEQYVKNKTKNKQTNKQEKHYMCLTLLWKAAKRMPIKKTELLNPDQLLLVPKRNWAVLLPKAN